MGSKNVTAIADIGSTTISVPQKLIRAAETKVHWRMQCLRSPLASHTGGVRRGTSRCESPARTTTALLSNDPSQLTASVTIPQIKGFCCRLGGVLPAGVVVLAFTLQWDYKVVSSFGKSSRPTDAASGVLLPQGPRGPPTGKTGRYLRVGKGGTCSDFARSCRT